jgi:hypothetical protein
MCEFEFSKRNKVNEKRLKDLYFSTVERNIAFGLEANMWFGGYQFEITDKGKFKLLNLSADRIKECKKSRVLFIPPMFEYVDEFNLEIILNMMDASRYTYSFVADGLLSIEKSSFFSERPIEKVSLKSCKSLPSHCFLKCKRLSEIDIEKVKIIDSFCFFDCINLSKVSIPNVKIIDEAAFKHCINLHLENTEFLKLSFLGVQAFSDSSIHSMIAPRLKLIQEFAFEHSKIDYFSGESVEKIDDEAFYYSQLRKIDVPNVKTLCSQCFGFTNIQEFISDSVIKLCTPFYNCNLLKTIELNAVKSFYSEIAVDCANLEKIVMNSCLICNTVISRMCSNLHGIYLPSMKYFSFRNISDTCNAQLFLNKNVQIKEIEECRSNTIYAAIMKQIVYV